MAEDIKKDSGGSREIYEKWPGGATPDFEAAVEAQAIKKKLTVKDIPVEVIGDKVYVDITGVEVPKIKKVRNILTSNAFKQTNKEINFK